MPVHGALQEAGRWQKLNHYLGAARRAGSISSQTANFAWAAWKHLSAETGHALSVPDAATGPNGELLYTWDEGIHHLELEGLGMQRRSFSIAIVPPACCGMRRIFLMLRSLLR